VSQFEVPESQFERTVKDKIACKIHFTGNFSGNLPIISIKFSMKEEGKNKCILAKKINESNDSVASCFNILIKLYDF